MRYEEQVGGRGKNSGPGRIATTAVIVGAIMVATHLVLGGTSSLALASVSILQGWPYFIGYALVIAGLLIHIAGVPDGKQHVVIAVSCGVVGALTIPIAWLYFGFGGIGLDTDDEVNALMAASIASLTPVLLAFGGGVFSWRTVNRTVEYRFRGMAITGVISAALVVACVVYARMTFVSPILG